MCNACGIYYKNHGTHRPSALSDGLPKQQRGPEWCHRTSSVRSRPHSLGHDQSDDEVFAEPHTMRRSSRARRAPQWGEGMVDSAGNVEDDGDDDSLFGSQGE